MLATRRGLLLLLALLLLWGASGYLFDRLERWHDAREFRLLVELINRKAELSQAVPSPRIIVAGGSNAYYGIDTLVLERRLGIPAVNVALPFGAHDLRINMAILKRLVRPGDIVVFADADFWLGVDKVQASVRRTRGFDSYLVDTDFPGYKQRFNVSDVPWIALPATNSLLLDLLDGFRRPQGRSWVTDTDRRGNYRGCVPVKSVKPQFYKKQEPNGDLVAALRSAAPALEAQGVRLLVKLPWMFIVERERDTWVAFRDRLISLYGPFVPVIAESPQELLRTDRQEFCDSQFHLSAEAARRHTATLADALKPYIDQPLLLPAFAF